MRVPRWRICSVLTAAVLGLAVILGGSSQRAMLSTAMLELASLPLLGVGLWWQARRGFRGAVWPVVILAAGLMVTMAQLAPLPLGLWRALPGRAAVLADLVAAGVAPIALPASLDPGATARCLVSLAPGTAIFFGVLAMSWDARRRLTQGFLALGALGAGVGFLQAANQINGFYSVTNPGSAVGFFANRNHFAALMYALLPFAAAMAAPSTERRASGWARRTIVYLAVGGLLGLGVVASASRTGLALALAAMLGCGVLWSRWLPAGKARAWIPLLAVGAAVVAVAALQFTRVGAFTQEKLGAVDEGRAVVSATTLHVARAYAPLGSGLGTFAALYAAAEPSTTLSTEYVNHAHDDWAELWLEAGAPLAGVIAAFLVWYLVMTVKAWSDLGLVVGRDQALRRAASISVALLLAHSALDYPLRTATLMTLLGFACALLATPPRDGVPRRQRRIPLIDTPTAPVVR